MQNTYHFTEDALLEQTLAILLGVEIIFQVIFEVTVEVAIEIEKFLLVLTRLRINHESICLVDQTVHKIVFSILLGQR